MVPLTSSALVATRRLIDDACDRLVTAHQQVESRDAAAQALWQDTIRISSYTDILSAIQGETDDESVEAILRLSQRTPTREILSILEELATSKSHSRRVRETAGIAFRELAGRCTAELPHDEKRSRPSLAWVGFRLSHELRTPVVAFRAILERLQAESAEKGIQWSEGRLSELASYAVIMSRLMQKHDVLACKSIELPLITQRQQLSTLVDAAVTDVSMLARQRRLDPKRIRRIWRMESPVFVVDRALVQLAFYCLLENSIKYAKSNPESFEILIVGDQRPKEFIVSIVDNGVGIGDEQDSDGLFAAGYSHLHRDAVHPVSSGVGLFVANRIVIGHGWRLELESKSDPTTFVIHIPSPDK